MSVTKPRVAASAKGRPTAVIALQVAYHHPWIYRRNQNRVTMPQQETYHVYQDQGYEYRSVDSSRWNFLYLVLLGLDNHIALCTSPDIIFCTDLLFYSASQTRSRRFLFSKATRRVMAPARTPSLYIQGMLGGQFCMGWGLNVTNDPQ